jgi:hypothetical protein
MVFAEKLKPSEPCDGCGEIIEYPEPNWDTAAYTCPESIRTAKGEFGFRGYEVFDAGIQHGRLKSEGDGYIFYTFSGAEEINIVCIYKGFNTNLVMPRLKGLIACGSNDKPSLRMGCWTTDPYAGKK